MNLRPEPIKKFSSDKEGSPFRTDAENPRVLGPMLKKWRKYNGWSQRELATKANVNSYAYSDFENGKFRKIAIEHFASIISAAGATSFEDLSAKVAALHDYPDAEILGPAIRHVRLQMGKTLKEVVRKTDIVVQHYSLFEQGKHQLPGFKIDVMLKNLGFSNPQELLEEERKLPEGPEPVNMRSFGIALKKHRYKLNISQASLAEKAGLPKQYINRLEQLSNQRVAVSSILKIPPALDCSSLEEVIQKAENWPLPPKEWIAPYRTSEEIAARSWAAIVQTTPSIRRR